ncbi:MAG: hypothetical protein R3E66_07350 [bacterium]
MKHLIVTSLLVFPLTASAQDVAEAQQPYAVELSAYGEVTFSFLNWEANQTTEGGARTDRRLVFDTTRLATTLEVELPRI